MSQKKRSLARRFGHALEATLLAALFGLFRLLPLDAASTLGGKLAQRIGPCLRWHRIAAHNLARALPDLSEAERTATLTRMWDNLGRTLAEYPWLGTAALAARIRFSPKARAIFEGLQQERGQVIFAGAHQANWEIMPMAISLQGIGAAFIYRKVNNPYVERMIRRLRNRYSHDLHPKGKAGAAAAVRAMKSGGCLGMLIDQKMNDGVEVSFFGLPAMTAPAVAEFSLKYGAPVLLIHLRRMGTYFEMDLLEFSPADFVDAPVPRMALLQALYRQMEQWITEEPGQWLWLHQRWGKVKFGA